MISSNFRVFIIRFKENEGEDQREKRENRYRTKIMKKTSCQLKTYPFLL